MIAVPIDSAKPDIMSSKLFGNATMFAFYLPCEEQFFIQMNTSVGNGVDTAKFLKAKGVETVLYTHMGDGLFNKLDKDGIDVYYIGKEPQPIVKLIDSFNAKELVKVEQSNAKEYLDPGTPSDSCGCGCTHD